MNRDYFIELFQYNDWANRRVLDCVMKITEESYLKENDVSGWSVHMQILHYIHLERVWISLLATGELKTITEDKAEIYKNRDKLRQFWDETNETNMTYIQSLSDDELQRKVRAPWWEATDSSTTVSQALTHVANHSTDHRAQTMAVLHSLGYEGVDQGFFAYLHRSIDKT